MTIDKKRPDDAVYSHRPYRGVTLQATDFTKVALENEYRTGHVIILVVEEDPAGSVRYRLVV